MFCSKCGQQIPDNASFCNKCGAKATANPAPQPQSAPAAATANTTTQPSGKQQPKKKGSFLVTLIVVAAAFLIGKYVLAPGMVSTPNTPTIEKTSTTSAAYNNIFSSRNIVQSPHIFVGMDSATYALVDEDGIVENLAFGYSGDLIKELVYTIYFPLGDLTANDIPAVDESMREIYSAYEDPGFCSVSYHTTNNYYVVTFTIQRLDTSVNVQKLNDAGILSTSGSSLLSMYQTENNLLADGFVKK